MEIKSAARSPRQIMIVSDDRTGGHGAAARAVNDALHELDSTRTSPVVDAKIYDFYELGSAARNAARAQTSPVNMAPEAARAAFSSAMTPSASTLKYWHEVTPFVKDEAFPEGRALVAQERPAFLLSVHMDTNALANAWRKKGALQAPTHCVVTDYIAHYVWASRAVDRYYVASEDVKNDLVRYGVKARKIEVTGIPISPRIAAPDARSKQEVKEKLGLDPNLPVVLILGGSLGDQKYLPILRALQDNGNDAQVVAVCGRNESQRKLIEDSRQEFSFPVHALPFVDMADYYHVADVVITKPGGLTMAELFARGKATVIVSPIAGMEEAQAQRLSASGVAVYGESPQTAGALARRLLRDGAERQALESRAKAFGRPNAASTIAHDILATMRGPASRRWSVRDLISNLLRSTGSGADANGQVRPAIR